MINFFYGDPHFFHANVIKYANRPFGDVEEMNEELVQRYRDRVEEHDTVAFLGDVAFGDEDEARSLLRRLPGRKILIRGNHDGTVSRCLRLGCFEFVVDRLYLEIRGCKVTVCHYPPAGSSPDRRFPDRRPPKPEPQCFVLHGHSHSTVRYRDRRINVSLEAWNYCPVPRFEVSLLVNAERRRWEGLEPLPDVSAAQGVPEAPPGVDPGS